MRPLVAASSSHVALSSSRCASKTPMRRCLIDAPVGPSGVSEILHAAVHEAGHAVIARAFGIFGGGARIYVIDEGLGGNTITAGLACLQGIWSRSGKHRQAEVAVRAEIIIAAAGAEAEWMLFGWPWGRRRSQEHCPLARISSCTGIALRLPWSPLPWPRSSNCSARKLRRASLERLLMNHENPETARAARRHTLDVLGSRQPAVSIEPIWHTDWTG